MKIPMLLPHLDTFQVAAMLLSFTKAAKLMGVTQAAVSQRIGQLEGKIGKPVFDRVKGRVELNENGKRLLKYAKSIHETHQLAFEILTEEEEIIYNA